MLIQPIHSITLTILTLLFCTILNLSKLSTWVDAIVIPINIHKTRLSLKSPENWAAKNITIVPETHNAVWSVNDPRCSPALIFSNDFLINADPAEIYNKEGYVNPLTVLNSFLWNEKKKGNIGLTSNIFIQNTFVHLLNGSKFTESLFGLIW